MSSFDPAQHPRDNASQRFAAKSHTAADVSLPGTTAAAERIAAIGEQFAQSNARERADLVVVHRHINEGAWGDIRDNAWVALRHLDDADARAAAASGLDGSDMAIRNADRALAEAVYDDAFAAARTREYSDDRYNSMSVAHDAAVAEAYASRVGSVSGWTEEAYEHLTRPWRTVFPDERPTPASWARRPFELGDQYL